MSTQKSIWITYAWEDNKDREVEFIAQELSRIGLIVKLDRWNLTAGKRLWEQIESFIKDTSKSDGWLLYATQNSLGNEKCKEEYYYALDRALETRGGEFPVIALFSSTVDEGLIPAGIKTRLFVSITDPDWKERIIGAVENRQPSITKPQVEPYVLNIHPTGGDVGDKQYVIEVRPRAGTWSPFIAGIPLKEKDDVSPHLGHGPAKRIPGAFMLISCGEGESPDHNLWIMSAGNEATPTQSYYVFCKKLPSTLIFGVNGSAPQYQIKF
jgi:hypothetical protein